MSIKNQTPHVGLYHRKGNQSVLPEIKRYSLNKSLIEGRKLNNSAIQEQTSSKELMTIDAYNDK